jgi:hypothetical protein
MFTASILISASIAVLVRMLALWELSAKSKS